MEITLFDKDKNINLRQSNFLIEARYKLTLQEFRIVTIIMSMISPYDDDFKEYRIDMGDIKRILHDIREKETDKQVNSESLIANLKKATKGLLSKPLIIINDNITIQANWISSAKFEKGKNYVTARLAPELKPYLLKIRSNYTDFELQELLSLKSFYSAKMYELMKQYYPNIPKRKFKVDELQELLGCSYPKYGNFKDRVPNSAVMEINNKTGLNINFEEKKDGKRITDIVFNIRGKDDLKKIADANNDLKEEDKKGKKEEDKKEKKEGKEKQVNKLETLDDTKKYFSDKGYKSNPEKFFNHYKARKWRGISDRSAVADNWELTFKEQNPDLYKNTLNGSNSEITIALDKQISINNDDPLWLKLSEIMKSDFEKDVYEKWLSKLSFVDVKDGKMTLATESKFLRDWIKREHLESLCTSFQQVEQSLKSINIIYHELQINN